MRAVVLPRRGGKTENMLRWLLEDKSHVLIVATMRERERLTRYFTHDGRPPEAFYIDRIRDIAGVMAGRYRGTLPIEPRYGIDELGFVLGQVLAGQVDVVSFTGEVEGVRHTRPTVHPYELPDMGAEMPCAICGRPVRDEVHS